MYLYKVCSHSGCPRHPISAVDDNGELVECSDFCFKHTPNPELAMEKLTNYIKTHDKIIGMNIPGITLVGNILADKRFYGCNFSNCFLSDIKTENLRIRMSVFDFAVFTDCNFSKSNIQFSSFAGAKFIHVLFTGSELIQNNFSGLESIQSAFDDSDLYNSRFIKASLVDTSIRNCNIKNTIFTDFQHQNVSFRMSNTNEAIFDDKGSALFTGRKIVDADIEISGASQS